MHDYASCQQNTLAHTPDFFEQLMYQQSKIKGIKILPILTTHTHKENPDSFPVVSSRNYQNFLVKSTDSTPTKLSGPPKTWFYIILSGIL